MGNIGSTIIDGSCGHVDGLGSEKHWMPDRMLSTVTLSFPLALEGGYAS